MGSQKGGRALRTGFAPLGAPVLIGLLLRAWNLDEQILGDDELHAVRVALALPLGEILVTWRETDHSLPLTALYRLWLDAGGRLSDGVLRAPPLIGSFLLIGVAPWLAGPAVGTRRATLWSWLLALAPLLVFYGRFVRSYSLTVALCTLAFVAFVRLCRDTRARFMVLYAFAGAAAIWFHLGAGPFVASPLLVGFVLLSVGRARIPQRLRWARLLALAGATLALTALALAPGWATLERLIAAKRDAPGLDPGTALEVLQLHAGTPWPAVAALFWALVLLGWGLIWRGGRRELAVAAPGVLMGQVVGLLLLAPKLDSPTLAMRAFLVTLPVTLLSLTFALDSGIQAASERFRCRRGPLLTGLAAALVLCSPYLDRGLWQTSFRQHDDYLLFTRGRPSVGLDALPPLYRTLGRGPEGAIIELPWHPFWGFGHAFPAYQETHGRAVWVANDEPLAGHPQLLLRRYLRAQPGVLAASDARYAVVHLDLEQEERRVRAARDRPDETRPQGAVWAALRASGQEIRGRLGAAWGPPDMEDRAIAIWDLERVRREQYAPAADTPIY